MQAIFKPRPFEVRLFIFERRIMNRIALLGIVVEDLNSAAKINEILHDCSSFILGRMGIPCRERGVSVMSIVLDAPDDIINSVSGKIGMLSGVSAKTIYSKISD